MGPNTSFPYFAIEIGNAVLKKFHFKFLRVSVPSVLGALRQAPWYTLVAQREEREGPTATTYVGNYCVLLGGRIELIVHTPNNVPP